MSPTTLPTARRAPPPGLNGRHVVLAMVSFFGIVFAVNGVMMYQAIATNGGLVASEPYRKGLDYNRRIEADERQQHLGWAVDAGMESAGLVSVTIRDAAGEPLRGLALTGTIGRPAGSQHDVKLTFAEAAPGRYVAQAAGLEPGTWQIAADARVAAGAVDLPPVYRLKRRLWLAP